MQIVDVECVQFLADAIAYQCDLCFILDEAFTIFVWNWHQILCLEFVVESEFQTHLCL